VPDALAQLFLPAECLLCGSVLPFVRCDDIVCAVCRHRWRPVRPPWCGRCGQPEPHFGSCRLCREWPAELGQVRSAVWLDAPARRAVHALKYGGLPRIAADLAAVMAKHVAPPEPGACLVPIPLAPHRLRRRGYNQSEALARALGAAWGVPVRVGVLERIRETATQTTLTPAARLANVAGAFRARNGKIGMRNEVLVDDVFTTGATLAAAAQALARGGATRIAAVTFGRAVIPDFT